MMVQKLSCISCLCWDSCLDSFCSSWCLLKEGNFPLCKKKLSPSMQENTAQKWTINEQRVPLVACTMAEWCAGLEISTRTWLPPKICDFCHAQGYPEKMSLSICRAENLPGDLHPQPLFCKTALTLSLCALLRQAKGSESPHKLLSSLYGE